MKIELEGKEGYEWVAASASVLLLRDIAGEALVVVNGVRTSYVLVPVKPKYDYSGLISETLLDHLLSFRFPESPCKESIDRFASAKHEILRRMNREQS